MHALPTKTASDSATRRLQSTRVLILDDDSFMLDIISEMLAQLGIDQVMLASDGAQALTILKNEAPDLLLCDLSMPEMDGIEFLRFVATQGYAGSVIVHSGADEGVLKAAERLAKAHGLNVLGAFHKPIDPDLLRSCIAQLGQFQPGSKPTLLTEATLTIEELRTGIAAGCVEIYFQPKVSVQARKMVAVECLARWRHPVRGILPPSAFIALIEQHHLIDEFTLLVLQKGTQQLGQWLRQGHDFKIAVNVSMDNLNRLDLPEIFHKIVTDAGVQTRHVVLEMTETRLMANLTLCLEILTRLRLKGFGLSIDDFGTGFSTMENLKQLPFSELKIDRAFVDGASNDAATRTILESSISLGKLFHLNLVAEGVETEQDWNLIATSGCDEVQGYYVAKPMPAEQLIAWKQQWESSLA